MPEIPFAHKWTIPENQLLPLKKSNFRCLSSTPVTNIPEFEYFLKISPNGDEDEEKDRGQTWIFLYFEFKNIKKVEADFKFTIESANVSKPIHYVYEESTGWGDAICSTEEFFDAEKKFFVDGKFNIKVNGIFKYEIGNAISSAIEQKWDGGALGDEFWKKEDTRDFTIITSDGKEIKVHKSILDVRSGVFTAMLNSNMIESKENKVTIPYFPSKVVETALKIIYDCNFTSSLTVDELMQLLQFFDKYLLQTIKAKVEPYLIAKISPSTVVRLTNFSIQTNSPKLKEKCIEFLMAAFQSKTALADIDDLDKDILLEMFKNSLFGTLETEGY